LSGAKGFSSRQTSGSYISVSPRISSVLDPFDAVIPCDKVKHSLRTCFHPCPSRTDTWTEQSRSISRQTGQGTTGTDADGEDDRTGARRECLVTGCRRGHECMPRRRQRGRRAPKQTIAYNQVFGHARREGGARSDRDQIENGVVKTERYFKTQMRCRSSGTLEEAAHCSSALGAFEPAAGARRRS